MRKQMKKIGTVLLAAAMTFGLVGCGAKKDSTVVATEAETPSAIFIWLSSFLHTIREPVVSLSIRCTIPGRISPLIPERLSLQ